MTSATLDQIALDTNIQQMLHKAHLNSVVLLLVN